MLKRFLTRFKPDRHDEHIMISKRRKIVEALILITSGMLLSSALPPLNWSFTAYFALVVPIIFLMRKTVLKAAIGGWFLGLGYFFPSFYFLREIDPSIPYLITPILALYMAVFGALTAVFFRAWLMPLSVQLAGFDAVKNFTTPQLWRQILFIIGVSSAFCLSEYLRSNVLPWNFLAVTQWQNLSFIQIADLGGTYAVGFVLLLINTSIVLLYEVSIRSTLNSCCYHRPWPFILMLIILMGVLLYGVWNKFFPPPEGESELIRIGLVQGDISQRRNANFALGNEALEIYIDLSEKLAEEKPDLIIWPESAVPFPYRANYSLSERLRSWARNFTRRNNVPLLIGTLDYIEVPDDSEDITKNTNTALLLNTQGRISGRFDKIHLVPFGEYVPFRKYLPEFIVKRIDMNRDLHPGSNFAPLNLNGRIQGGMNICFEDVFPDVSANATTLGANLLLTITNDAWYPVSSEPEQHLANSIFRAIECNRPFIRSGNNSGSCLIMPDGKITKSLLDNPIMRGRDYGVIEVNSPLQSSLTFYTQHPNLFTACIIVVVLSGIITMAGLKFKKRQILKQTFQTGKAGE